MGLFSSNRVNSTTTNTANVTVNPENNIIVDNTGIFEDFRDILGGLFGAVDSAGGSIGSGISGAGVNLAFAAIAAAGFLALRGR